MARQIRGWEELKRNLNRLAQIAGDQDVRDGVYGIAVEAAGEVRARAPQGKTGNLKRSVVAKQFKRKGDMIAFTAIDRKIAPHAHLVENGHMTRGGGNVPAHPFFKPVMNRYRNGKYLKRVQAVLQAKIKKVRPDGVW